jgi:hypothetical protein
VATKYRICARINTPAQHGALLSFPYYEIGMQLGILIIFKVHAKTT